MVSTFFGSLEKLFYCGKMKISHTVTNVAPQKTSNFPLKVYPLISHIFIYYNNRPLQEKASSFIQDNALL
jgi:hypothetical protein